MSKSIHFSLVCFVALQVLFALAIPIEDAPENGFEAKLSEENEEEHLATRALWNMVPSGVLTSMAQNAVFGPVGNKAVRSIKGSVIKAAVGVNPYEYIDMSRDAVKNVVKRAQEGTITAASVTNQALNTIQDLHDKKVELCNQYVKPHLPTSVTEFADSVNDKVGSTIGVMKEKVAAGVASALVNLKSYEKNLEKGGPIVTKAVKNMVTNPASWVRNFLPSGETQNIEKGKETAKKKVEKELKNLATLEAKKKLQAPPKVRSTVPVDEVPDEEKEMAKKELEKALKEMYVKQLEAQKKLQVPATVRPTAAIDEVPDEEKEIAEKELEKALKEMYVKQLEAQKKLQVPATVRPTAAIDEVPDEEKEIAEKKLEKALENAQKQEAEKKLQALSEGRPAAPKVAEPLGFFRKSRGLRRDRRGSNYYFC